MDIERVNWRGKRRCRYFACSALCNPAGYIPSGGERGYGTTRNMGFACDNADQFLEGRSPMRLECRETMTTEVQDGESGG